jgi:hypothetical protein
MVNDDGRASCWQSATGEKQWLERLGTHHSASPVSAEGFLYFPDDEGTTYVLRASNRFELVARNEVHEECYSSPAIAHGQLFLRTLHHLHCIGAPQKNASR